MVGMLARLSAFQSRLGALAQRRRLTPAAAAVMPLGSIRRREGFAGTEAGSRLRTRQTVRIAEHISRRCRGSSPGSCSRWRMTSASMGAGEPVVAVGLKFDEPSADIVTLSWPQVDDSIR